MKIFLSVFCSSFLCFVLLAPQSSQAYLTTAQSAKAVSSTTALFTITYHFGFLTRELYMPIIAKRDLIGTTTSSEAAFTLLDHKGATTTIGLMNGIVLSTATIKDGQYYLPAGTSADFTLVAALTVPTSTSSADYALQVTALPFTMIDNNTTVVGHLNPSELQYYVTPEIELNPIHTVQVVRVTGTTHLVTTTGK